MASKRIALSLSSPVLGHAVREQLALMADVQIAETDADQPVIE